MPRHCRSLGEVGTESGPGHVAALRSAIDWLDRGLDVAPDDAEFRATLTAARDAPWPAHETIVKGLVQRQEFARGLPEDLLAEAFGKVPALFDRAGAERP